MKNRWIKFARVAGALLVLLFLSAGAVHAQESAPTAVPGGAQGETQPEQPNNPATEENMDSDLYDPSIFIIEASGTWRQELAEGYYVDFECELYLDKVDSNDNRVADGLYTGALWMSTKVEISDYLKELLKDVPVDMDFDAGGEGICDNLTVHLLSEYGREPWRSYGIPAEDGEIQPPEGALVAEGGFIAVAKDAYLNIHASGAQGESVGYSNNQSADAEVSYIIHIEPDPENTAAERKVTVYLYNADGMSATFSGIWRRIPGYPEDVLDYAGSGKAREILDRHLE